MDVVIKEEYIKEEPDDTFVDCNIVKEEYCVQEDTVTFQITEEPDFSTLKYEAASDLTDTLKCGDHEKNSENHLIKSESYTEFDTNNVDCDPLAHFRNYKEEIDSNDTDEQSSEESCTINQRDDLTLSESSKAEFNDEINTNHGNKSAFKVRKGRKRPAAKDEWTANNRKRKRNFGLEYINRTGKLIPSRKLQPPCTKCRLKCHDRISEDIRQELFKKFWAFGNLLTQRQYIHNLMDIAKLPDRKRKSLVQYKLIIDGTTFKVCKKFFLKTFDLTNKFIRTIIIKSIDGKLEGEHRGRKRRK
ncbi:uncharacterized protein LOC129801317 isoform X1 [Phlebotomus papatasi]|uniref:uncharacterized protein LOC129801317 isoform X1 n=1 Tax=Phlebotomus papatasi TaxID=29031 RepID=UPI002483EA57|nr:uncharacterized protein LOC129801317 isoform X1 [Phlebotomus papatasi]